MSSGRVLKLIAAIGLLLLLGSPSWAEPPIVNYPVTRAPLRSPASGPEVLFKDFGLQPDGIHDLRLLLRRPGGRVEPLHSFMRNVDVSWAPNGRWLFISDAVGSNLAECLVADTSGGTVRKRSMTEAITKIAAPTFRRQLLHGDHVYVACTRWLSPRQVEVRMYGDLFPNRFDHRFVYDVRTGSLRSARPAP